MIGNIIQYIISALVIMGGVYHFVQTVQAVRKVVVNKMETVPQFWMAMVMHFILGLVVFILGAIWFLNPW